MESVIHRADLVRALGAYAAVEDSGPSQQRRAPLHRSTRRSKSDTRLSCVGPAHCAAVACVPRPLAIYCCRCRGSDFSASSTAEQPPGPARGRLGDYPAGPAAAGLRSEQKPPDAGIMPPPCAVQVET